MLRRVLGLALSIALSCPSLTVAQERHTAAGKHVPVFEEANKRELLGDQLMEEGKKDEARKAYVAALGQYQRVLTIEPSFLPAYIRLSRLHGLLNQYLAGAALMKHGLKRYPNSAELKEALATHLTLGGYKREGVALLEEVAKAQPDKLAVQELLADHYLADGPVEKAIKPLTVILEKRPEADKRRVELGGAQLRLGKIAEAQATFHKIGSSSPFYPEARMGIGDAMLQSEKPAEALAMYQELERTLRPPSRLLLELQLRISQSLQHLRRYDEALGRYRAFIAKSPKDSRGYYGAGECLRLAGRNKEAIEQLQYSLQLYSRSPRVYGSLARATLASRDIPAAIRWQEQAIRLAPNDWQLSSFLGRLYRKQNRLSKALATHRELLATRAWSAELHAELGHDHFYLEQLDEANAAYTKALQIERDLPDAKTGLVLLGLRQVARMLQAKQLNEAAKLAEGLLKHNVLGGEVVEFLAAVALERGDAKKALEWLDHSKVQRAGWRRLLLRGRAELSRGEAKAALGVLRRIDTAKLSRQDAAAVEHATAAAELMAGDYIAATSRAERLATSSQQESVRRLLAASLVARANHYWVKGKAQLALKDATRAAQMKALLSPTDAERTTVLVALAAAESGQKNVSLKAVAELEKKPVTEAALEKRYRGKEGKQALRAILNHLNGAYELAAKAVAPLVKAKQAPVELKELQVANLRAWAHHLYQTGNVTAARTVAQDLQRASPSLSPADELLLACTSYTKEPAAAVAVFRKLANRVPEAQLDLGIYLDEVTKDKRGAYDSYVAYVRRAGARSAPIVQKWIKTKQRVFGYK
jgi:tetratricopeptide (TPR) repeat protein